MSITYVIFFYKNISNLNAQNSNCVVCVFELTLISVNLRVVSTKNNVIFYCFKFEITRLKCDVKIHKFTYFAVVKNLQKLTIVPHFEV